MGTAPIDTSNSRVLVLLENLRRHRAAKWSTPSGCQMVPLELLDQAILMIADNALDAEERTRFDDAWGDR